ncbi:carbohydrate ABC transporter permease [Candidatus Chloroploca sp. M-50]|uniref:Carbohydrate ABC transporter permease n=1 Tax=Candidatus Chloroploca mongolica TaxID=2528176 RepID=A0ABS4D5Y7_9CHLR|nr:carbohydrate ABC transporter permease [Candidatus Chloroploca mongolica]MBP1464849.1 carbohydrate ABC transporter permease [Candidatus Chloroploca mongolica]
MAAVTAKPVTVSRRAVSQKRQQLIGKIIVNTILGLICLLWTIPTVGLFISSFRPRDDIRTTGWWTVLPHRAFDTVETVQLPPDTNLRAPITLPAELGGGTYTSEQLNAGVVVPGGEFVTWENRRARTLAIQEQSWTVNANFTLDNYRAVTGGREFTYIDANGNEVVESGEDLWGVLINNIAVVVPATVIPILIAAFAAYGFAWMRFPGRFLLFTIVVALLVVPLQVALIPILRDFVSLDLNGTYMAVWLAHTGFGLPLATYLLYNYISQLPRDILESAFIDGASHFTIFTRLILPLSVPALASFAIFQFLWVWNDYLIALVFIGSQPNVQVLTMRLADMVGSRGQDWHVLTAGAFISMLIPLIVFFSLQRYFVRGLLAGSVKG